MAYKSTKGTLPSSAIPLVPGWALPSKQMAECWTVIQIQTSDCCWQSLVGLQVAFICLLESWSPFSPSTVLTYTDSIKNSSWLQHKFELLPLLPVYTVYYCDKLLQKLICADAYWSPEHKENYMGWCFSQWDLGLWWLWCLLLLILVIGALCYVFLWAMYASSCFMFLMVKALCFHIMFFLCAICAPFIFYLFMCYLFAPQSTLLGKNELELKVICSYCSLR